MKPDTGTWVWSWPLFQPSLPALNLPTTCPLSTSNKSAENCLPRRIGSPEGRSVFPDLPPAHCSWLCTYNTQSHTYTPHRVTHACSHSSHKLTHTQLYPHTYTHNHEIALQFHAVHSWSHTISHSVMLSSMHVLSHTHSLTLLHTSLKYPWCVSL